MWPCPQIPNPSTLTRLASGVGEMPEETGASGNKRAKTSPEPPVASLGDDLLRDILLRLPDMESLARAALVCKLWHGVASDPTVFRRFDALRRPPLVGFLLTDGGNVHRPRHSPHMLFLQATRNPNLAAAGAHGDFFFEDLHSIAEEEGYAWDEWRLRGCDGGLQLLSLGYKGLDLAVYDPIARTAVFLHVFDVFGDMTHRVRYAFVVDESDGSFLIIGIDHNAAIFSSRTGKWTTFQAHDEFRGFLDFYSAGMRAGRFAYWRSNTKKNRYRNLVERILVLDTTTMEWSIIDAPFLVGESYCVTDMPEHGGLCLMSSKEQCLQLWFRNSIGEWVLMKIISLLNDRMKKISRDESMKRLRILTVRGNYVYMEFWSIRKPNSYFIVFNLRTSKMTLVHNNAEDPYRGPAFPFFMRLKPLLGLDEGQNVHLNGV